MAALLFLDTETTGLGIDDDVWELAAVLRHDDGTEADFHAFVAHDAAKARKLPPEFRDDHDARWDLMTALVWGELVTGLLGLIGTEHRPHLVGAVPDFDDRHLRRIFHAKGRDVPWHYHLIDVEGLAVGYLRGLTAEYDPARITLPWDSDELSRAIGVEPPGDGVRHTAMGDVRWAMAVYDTVMGG